MKRSAKRYHAYQFLAVPLMIAAAMMVWMPPALSQVQVLSGGIRVSSCAPGVADWQLTQMIVTCVRNAVLYATTQLIVSITAALSLPARVLFTMAVIFLGFRYALGEKDLPRTTYGFMFRFGLVVFFFFYMIQLALLPFVIIESMLAIVTGGWSPWLQMDSMIAQLLGFGPGLGLFQGVLGLLGAALFSASHGLFLFLFGFMTIMFMLSFMMRAVYTYLLAIVYIGFLMSVSPLVIPVAVFGMLERYVKKWLDLLISAMLMPIMLFAFLWVFLGLIGSYVSSIFVVLGGNNFGAFWRIGAPFFSWAMMTDPELLKRAEGNLGNKGAPLVQGLMNPLMGRAFDPAIVGHVAVHFGPQHAAVVQGLILHFIAMAIVCLTMKKMMETIPRVSDEIAQVSTGLNFEKIEMVENIKKALSKVTQKG